MNEYKNAVRRAALLEGFRNENFENFSYLTDMLKNVKNGSLNLTEFKNRLNKDGRLSSYADKFVPLDLYSQDEKETLDQECVMGVKRLILKF